MPISYVFQSDPPCVRTTVQGSVGVPEISDHLETIQREPWFPCSALVDTRQASDDLTNAEVRSIVALLTVLSPRMRGARIAVVVPSEVAYGLVRMIGIMLEDRVAVLPFYDLLSAEAWLALS